MGEQKRESRTGMWTVIEGLVLVLIIAASVPPPQADELVSNLDETNGEIAKVWSAQHHAQTFATGGHEPGYLVESVELDVASWTEDANVTVSVHSAWSSGGPGDHLYTLENPTRGTGRKVFTVRKRDRVRLVERQPHAIVIRNTGGKGSFNLHTTTSINPTDESDWRIENARWTTNPSEVLDRWVGVTGAIKVRINDRDAPPPLSVAPANIRIREGRRDLTIEWDEVPRATGYYVQWKWEDQEFGNERQRYVDGAHSTRVRLRLAAGAGQRHMIRVRATNGGVNGPWSDNLAATPKMGLLVECTQ